MSNKEDMIPYEKGIKLFLIGFLLMLFGALFDFIDLDAIAGVIAWIGFFIAAAGIIINLQLLFGRKRGQT